MSMDKSLKSRNTLERHRNVLTRAERIQVMKEAGRWTEESTATGLPKIGHRKASVGKKAKEAKTTADAATDEAAEEKK